MHTSRWNWLSWLALVVGVVGLALLGLSGPAYRMGWVSLGTALRQMLAWGAFAGIGAGGLALLALVVTGRRASRGGRVAALLALVVGLGSAYIPWQWQRAAQGVPAIHDISTDTVTPPGYVETAVIRREQKAPNGLEYSAEVAALQVAAYPDVTPLFLTASADEAYRKAVDLVRARGWDVVATDDAGRRIEATDTTYFFGFKDDVAIRVSPIPDGSSRVDIRSVSRVGRSDIGINAKRIRALLADLRK